MPKARFRKKVGRLNRRVAIRCSNRLVLRPRTDRDPLSCPTNSHRSRPILLAGTGQSRRTELLSTRIDVANDNEWHSYEVVVPATGPVHRLRFDPAMATGTVIIDQIELEEIVYHPLEIREILADDSKLRVEVHNRSKQRVAAALRTQDQTIAPNERFVFEMPRKIGDAAFNVETFAVDSPDVPPLRRTVVIHNPSVADRNWAALSDARTNFESHRMALAPVFIAKER